MENNHLLLFNPHKIIRCLETIISEVEIEKISDELQKNVKQLLGLGRSHLSFAKQVNGPASWRQRVSRAYYGAYCTSRAVRLAINGIYNVDPADHKRISDLPNDFPEKTTWEDFLTKFRADRNLADYDHTVSEKALELKSKEYVKRTNYFCKTARDYLISRGVI